MSKNAMLVFTSIFLVGLVSFVLLIVASPLVWWVTIAVYVGAHYGPRAVVGGHSKFGGVAQLVIMAAVFGPLGLLVWLIDWASAAVLQGRGDTPYPAD